MGLKSFASDNNAGVHPEILEAIQSANRGHVTAYGDDPYTAAAISRFREHFGDEVEVFFVFNGTAANTLSLQALTEPYHSILCAESAHVQVDECGAPERFTGCKLLPLPSTDGKIGIAQVEPCLQRMGDQHHSQPKVISISQPTEFGTLYDLDEIRKITGYAHERGLKVHMDGARLANAAAALGAGLREVTADVGVDVLSFGGTKNGLMFGEAVVLFDRRLGPRFTYIRKQGLQLASKMRFIAVQFDALLSNGLWLRNARHANAMADLLRSAVEPLPHLRLSQKVQVNSLFATLPREHVARLLRDYYFYVWNERTSEVRWMTAFDTSAEDVLAFARSIRDVGEGADPGRSELRESS